MARLGGKGKAAPPGTQPLTRLERWELPGMTATRAAVEYTNAFWGTNSPNRKAQAAFRWSAYREGVSVNEARLAAAVSRSEQLIEDALAEDPRLARRPSWVRAEIGEFAEPSLVACGDDAPCFTRSRSGLQQWSAAGDPVRIVISTDANEVKADTPAAFIATARLVMQFAPLEIWWQGAWLDENEYKGYVFHVPLLQNDTDFSKLEFCIASNKRDELSYCIAIHRAAQTRMNFPKECAGRATRSFLGNTKRFINHEGIVPNGWNIANEAAHWLGWETFGTAQWRTERESAAALQSLPQPSPPHTDTRTPEQKKTDDQWWKDYCKRQAAEKEAARRKRLASVNA
jgi:hypothetical protein